MAEKYLCKYLYKDYVGKRYQMTDENGTRWQCTAVNKGRPYACIVFLDKNRYGWCHLAAADFLFNSYSKKELREVAISRAQKGTKKQMPKSLKVPLENLQLRANRYFK